MVLVVHFVLIIGLAGHGVMARTRRPTAASAR